MFFIQKATWFRRQIWIWGNIIYGVGHSPAKLGPRPAPQRFWVFSRTRRSRKKTCPGIASFHASLDMEKRHLRFKPFFGQAWPQTRSTTVFRFFTDAPICKKNMSRQKNDREIHEFWEISHELQKTRPRDKNHAVSP